jgi:hypothetical protein
MKKIYFGLIKNGVLKLLLESFKDIVIKDLWIKINYQVIYQQNINHIQINT